MPLQSGLPIDFDDGIIATSLSHPVPSANFFRTCIINSFLFSLFSQPIFVYLLFLGSLLISPSVFQSITRFCDPFFPLVKVDNVFGKMKQRDAEDVLEGIAKQDRRINRARQSIQPAGPNTVGDPQGCVHNSTLIENISTDGYSISMNKRSLY